MFIASCLVWANAVVRWQEVSKPDILDVKRVEETGYGFPMICCDTVKVLSVENVWQDSALRWNAKALALNVAICLALLVVAAVAIEWLTWRKKRTPTS